MEKTWTQRLRGFWSLVSRSQAAQFTAAWLLAGLSKLKNKAKGLNVLYTFVFGSLLVNTILLFCYMEQTSSIAPVQPLPPVALPSSLDQIPVRSNTDLISYVYYETEEAKRNLEFFIAHGLHARADFVFIMNSECTVRIPKLPNIRVYYRNNTCFDMGAQKEILSQIDTSKYKRFILTNASIRGPFFPRWATNKCWSDKFFNKLDHQTKMVGLTMNCNYDDPRMRHIQSMLLTFDRIGFELAMSHFRCFDDYADAVNNGEIPLTRKFLDAGYAAETMAAVYDSYRSRTNLEVWDECRGLDIHFPHGYFGMDLHPFDSLFVKVKVKNPSSEYGQRVYETLSDWVDRSGFSSFEHC
ncbi:hypothetical protein HDV03_003856 [Kappamyces sp. JEL0829]|nr:hypothetical protein HDV03_003856 [Kappamyces sp. JEL0829]